MPTRQHLRESCGGTWRTFPMRDPGFEEMIQNLCARPGMFVIPTSFATVCVYIQGFDDGRGGSPLLGFREWLVLRHKGGSNLHWSGLVQILLRDVLLED